MEGGGVDSRKKNRRGMEKTRGEGSSDAGLLHRMNVEYLLNVEESGALSAACGSTVVNGGNGSSSRSSRSRNERKKKRSDEDRDEDGDKGRVSDKKRIDKDKGRRRFACERCPRAFEMRSNLKRHVSTVHEQRRVFCCDLCGAAFGLKQNLYTHVRVKHYKVRAFQCEVCLFWFGYKQVLQNHRRSIHGLM